MSATPLPIPFVDQISFIASFLPTPCGGLDFFFPLKEMLLLFFLAAFTSTDFLWRNWVVFSLYQASSCLVKAPNFCLAPDPSTVLAVLAGSSFSSQFLSFVHLACPPSITVCQTLARAAGTSRFPLQPGIPFWPVPLSLPEGLMAFWLFLCALCSAELALLPRTPCSALEMFLPCKLRWALLCWGGPQLLCAQGWHFLLPAVPSVPTNLTLIQTWLGKHV